MLRQGGDFAGKLREAIIDILQTDHQFQVGEHFLWKCNTPYSARRTSTCFTISCVCCKFANVMPGRRADAVPAATPQRSASTLLFLRSIDHVYAAESASPAPIGQTASTRGGSAS